MGDIASPLVRFSTSADSFNSSDVNSSYEFGVDCLNEPVFEEEDDDNDVIDVEEDLLLRQRTRSSRSRHATGNNDFSRESIVFEMSHQAQVEQIKRIADANSKIKKLWKLESRKALRKSESDSWAEIFEDIKPYKATRLRYNAAKETWLEDKIQIKIEPETFNEGAMRECFRAKKLGNFSMNPKWHTASSVVLKRYKESVDTPTLFEDVKLQMEAKMYSQLYNKRKPPKQIDIMQICIIKVQDYNDNEEYTHFQMEHFIEGDYTKFNSNSGFVSDDLRRTPQAFSHFSFEHSGREKMIIDIQGVNDLWTDPQIHSANGLDYGDGNLGIRGMALFLLSHRCNDICAYLNLPKFELHHTEKEGQLRQAIETTIAGLTKIETEKRRAERLESYDSVDSGHYSLPLSAIREGSNPRRSRHSSWRSSMNSSEGCGSEYSDCIELIEDNLIDENEKDELKNRATKEDILSAIHYATCQLYCQERIEFSNDASAFHLEIAARSGHQEAQAVLAKKLLGIPTDILEEIGIDKDEEKGFEFLTMASDSGDAYCTYLLARSYHTAHGLPDSQSVSFSEAIRLYQKLLSDGTEVGIPHYQLLEYQADIYLAGGQGIEKDATSAAELYEEAAEIATGQMKGKIAAKYYEKAEYAWAEVE